LLWATYALQLATLGLVTNLAIHPRTSFGLVGILFAPLLHGGVSHLLSNTIGFLTLAPLTMLRRKRDFWSVTVLSAITSGLGAWTLGATHSLHLGASGVIFGYLGFLMARGYFERRVLPVVLSVGVAWFFGGMLWGVVPVIAGCQVSWQAHLFGFLGGVGSARLLKD
jgi:membrane associated rhomboid family serine protease